MVLNLLVDRRTGFHVRRRYACTHAFTHGSRWTERMCRLSWSGARSFSTELARDMSMHVDRLYSMAIDRLGESFGRRPHTIYASDLREHGDARFIRNVQQELCASLVSSSSFVFFLSQCKGKKVRVHCVALDLHSSAAGHPTIHLSIRRSRSMRWIDRRHRRRWNREKPAERT